MLEKPILFVDDDYLPSNYYYYALMLRQLTVAFYEDVDKAVEWTKDKEPSLAILDVMMPPGPFASYDTREGLDTGLFLFRYLRDKYPNLPVVILTNVRTAPAMFRGEKAVKVVSKSKCPPLDLALMVEDLLGKETRKECNG